MNIEKKYQILVEILRASHFEWRRAALKLAPGIDAVELVKQYWREVGEDTAAFYLKQIDPQEDLARQVAELYVASSVAMGEDARVVEKEANGKVVAVHRDCPWFHWHKKMNLLEEDLPGCNEWLNTVIETINQKLGTRLRCETVESLPGGGKTCERRFWEEPK